MQCTPDHHHGGAPWDPTLGDFGNGTLFKYSPASQQLTNPLIFTGAGITDPNGAVVFDSQGDLYGVTSNGGTHGFGTLWEYSAQGVLTTLVNFTGLNGEIPMAGVTLDGKGNIYGTTYNGGASATVRVNKNETHGVIAHVESHDHSERRLVYGYGELKRRSSVRRRCSESV